MWYFNPPEPTGQPTQPGADYFRPFLNRLSDDRFNGRCGHCAGCPPTWRLVVPADLSAGGEQDPIELGPWGEIYGGNYYLRRGGYSNEGAGFGRGCAWYSRFLSGLYPTDIADQKRLSEYDLSSFQWVMGYGIYGSLTVEPNWWMYTPILDLFGEGARASVYKFDGPEHEWKCLGENRFIYYDQAFQEGDAFPPGPWPYRPTYLTVTPHYA